jgi:hypothetical protein
MSVYKCIFFRHAGLDPASRHRPDESRELYIDLNDWIPVFTGNPGFRSLRLETEPSPE